MLHKVVTSQILLNAIEPSTFPRN